MVKAAPTPQQFTFLSTVVNRTSKRVRVIAFASIAIATGAVVASAPAGALSGFLPDPAPDVEIAIRRSTTPLTQRSAAPVALAAPALDTRLNTARHGHTATLLSDGKVLVVGGENVDGFVTAAEIFDPPLGNFSVSGNLSTPRADHTATRLSDGRVLIAGGKGDLGSLSSTEIFDPATGAFAAGPNLIGARSGHTATKLGDGRIVLAGGDAAGSLEIYVPLLNSFTPAAANLSSPRAFHSAAVLNNGNILIVGGTAPDASGVLTGEIFNLVLPGISLVGNETRDPHVRATLRVLPDGKVQIIGGSDHEDMEIYDPAINAFGAHAHVYPISDSHPALLEEILRSPTRAALFHHGASTSLLNREGQTITELSESTQALVTGGVDSTGAVLDSASVLNSSPAAISTDRIDYAPGTPVIVTGTSWQPNEVVTLMFHEDPHVDTENPHTFRVRADADGNFVHQEYAPEAQDHGITYILAAKGGSSGRTAQTAFTDASPGSLGNYATSGLSGSSAPTTVPPSNVATNVTFSTLSRGAGLTGVAASDAFNSSAWQLTSTLTIAGNTDYYEFTITPNTGYKFSASELRVGLQRSGAGPAKAELRSSLDSYGSTIGSVLSVGTGLATFTINLSSVTGLQNRTAAVTFRIYGYNATSGGGTLRIQRVTSPAMVGLEVDGTVAAVNSGTLQFSAANYNDAETNSGTHTKTITVQRIGGSDGAVSVHYATSDGSAATAEMDYDETSGDLTWADGDSADKTFTVTVKGDTTYEADEIVNLTLSAPSGGATIGGSNPATLTITNDDAQPAISIDDVITDEGNTGTTSHDFTVSLSNPSDQAVTLEYATADDTATTTDYTVVPTTILTFLPGETTKHVTVLINGDNVFEASETFFVNLSNQTNSTITDPQGVGTIVNDDPVPSVSIDDTSQAESNAGSSNFDLAVTLSNPSDQTITVQYTTADGTATQPGDYTSASGTVIFMPGNIAETVSVSVNGDTTFESNETFFVNLDTLINATILDAQGQGTIENDDAQPTVQFSVASSSGSESVSPANLQVTLSNPSYQTIAINYAVTGGTATGGGNDYTLANGTLTFVAGDTSENVSIAVVDDALDEDDETVVVDLSGPTNATLGTPVSHTYTINDNDNAPTVQFALASSAGLESANASLEVTLSAASGKTVTVDYAATGGTATGGGTDYTLANGTLTFVAGDTSENVSIAVVDDALDEDDETVVVDLSNPSNATSGSPSSHTYTINDNDSAPSFAIDNVTLAEGNSGTTSFTFTVTKSGATALTATVDYATANGTTNPATGGVSCGAGIDYESRGDTFSFAPGDTTMSVTIKVCGDTVFESNETFFVNLSNESNATISDSQGVGTINNDDDAPTTTAVDNKTVTYSDSDQSVTLTATVTGSVINGGTVTFTVKDGATQIGSTAVSGTVTNGSASANYTLPGGTAPNDYTIEGVYSGTTGFTGSSDTATLTVDPSELLSDVANLDADFKKIDGFDVLFGRGATNSTLELKNTNPPVFHYRLVITNTTGAPLNSDNGTTARAFIEVPALMSCGGVPCASTVSTTLPAFSLKNKKAVHAHPDDRTDDMKVQYAYKSTGPGTCDNPAGYSTTFPADESPRCIMVSGFALPKKHRAAIDITFEFRWKKTMNWHNQSNLFFFAGFPFKATVQATFTSPATTKTGFFTVGLVGAGQRVTAIGGFAFNQSAMPTTGVIMRLFNSLADVQPCGTGVANKPVATDVVTSDGFYFIWRKGNDQGPGTNDLPDGVKYVVQACNGGTEIGLRVMKDKLGKKEFDEEDFYGLIWP